MEEVVLSQDNLKSIISFMNPCELKKFLSKNEFMMFLLDDNSVLYNLSRDYFIPYCKGIKLDEMCDFYNLPKIDLMMEATKMGDIRIIEYLIQPHIQKKYDIGSWDYSSTLYCAAEKGYKDIVEIILNSNRYEGNYENVMSAAARGGQIDIVQMMLDLGVDDYEKSLEYAAREGHKDIVSLLVSKIKEGKKSYPGYEINAYNNAMESAAWKGHKDIVQTMLDFGANNYNETMSSAADGGYIDIIQMMLDLGADNYNESMLYAAEEGHIDIVQMMLDLGANNCDEAIDKAFEYGQYKIVNLIEQYKRRKQ